MNSETRPVALVIGAGSAIARALIKQLLQADVDYDVVAISREQHAELVHPRVSFMACDYSAPAIREAAHTFNALGGRIMRVFVCTGVLHNADISPEKRLEDISADQMAAVFHINSIIPTLWLQSLLPALKNAPRCVLTVFSARVGSISDNRKGGWYSYRTSKAALNMVIKTAAIEYARRAPGVKLMAFHPGTVDTDLSRPFQKNVAPEHLFTPDFVATRLITITDSLPADGEASYLDWAGQAIKW